MYENVPPVSHVREVYGAECEAPYRAPPLPLRTLTYPIRHTLPRALGRPPALPAPWTLPLPPVVTVFALVSLRWCQQISSLIILRGHHV